jgi:hypothetical protein
MTETLRIEFSPVLLSAVLYSGSFHEVWISDGTEGRVTRAYTVLFPAAAGDAPCVVASTHHPVLEPDPFAVRAPLAADEEVLRLGVRREPAGAWTPSDIISPKAASGKQRAVCIDLYGIETGGERHQFRRRGTATVMWGHSGVFALEDWAAVKAPHDAPSGTAPVRGYVTVTFGEGCGGEGGAEAAAKRAALICDMKAEFLEGAAATLKCGSRALAGVQNLKHRYAAAGGWPDACVQRHMFSYFWCPTRESAFVSGGAVGFWMGAGAHGFAASEAWWLVQVECVLRERRLPLDFFARRDGMATTAEGAIVMDAVMLWIASQPYFTDRVEAPPSGGGAFLVVADTPTNAFVGMGNCKDDARAGCAVLSWLIFSRDFASPAARRTQRVARCYVPLLTFGASKPLGARGSAQTVGSHVYGIAMPAWKALEMGGFSEEFETAFPWVASAIEESRGLKRALALEGTFLVGSDVAGPRPSPEDVARRERIDTECAGLTGAGVWTREHAGFFRDGDTGDEGTMYLATTSATIPWFYRVGAKAPSAGGVENSRYWFTSDGGSTIGVLSRRVFMCGRGITLEEVPHFGISPQWVRELRKYERVTYMETNPLKRAAPTSPSPPGANSTTVFVRTRDLSTEIREALERLGVEDTTKPAWVGVNNTWAFTVP